MKIKSQIKRVKDEEIKGKRQTNKNIYILKMKKQVKDSKGICSERQLQYR